MIFHMGPNLCFFPTILMSSTNTDRNICDFRWTYRHLPKWVHVPKSLSTVLLATRSILPVGGHTFKRNHWSSSASQFGDLWPGCSRTVFFSQVILATLALLTCALVCTLRPRRFASPATPGSVPSGKLCAVYGEYCFPLLASGQRHLASCASSWADARHPRFY